MLKFFIIVLTLFLCPFAAAAQQGQTATKAVVPANAAQQVNPVKPTAESLAQGKKYYGYDCAMCHGNNGDGKGDVAIDEKLTLADFRDAATLRSKTDGELYYIIKNGHDHMPPEGDRLKPPDLWNLVNYIRSFANTKAQ
jgi:mono/diheme cytochrome c family protein